MKLHVVLLTIVIAGCGTGTPESDRAAAAPRGAEEGVLAPGEDAPTPETAGTDEPGPRYVHAGAPGEDSRELTADEVAGLGVPGHSDADVRFMQGMIPHHAQAIEMVALMLGRTTNERLLRLGGRIEISQRDEIALMERWLRERGEAIPGQDGATGHDMAAGGHGGMHGGLMPGMLTPEQMRQLGAAEGAAFDRLFVELMIGHHQGALVMVKELFSTPGGGQESWTFQFASDVDADQEMEIRRMRQMLDEMR